jgi:hypothetical protein
MLGFPGPGEAVKAVPSKLIDSILAKLEKKVD